VHTLTARLGQQPVSCAALLQNAEKQPSRLTFTEEGNSLIPGSRSATTDEGACVTADLSALGSDVEKEERQARHFTLAHCIKEGDGKRTS